MIKSVIHVFLKNKRRVAQWALGFAALLGAISFSGQWIGQGYIRVQGVVMPSFMGFILGAVIIYYVICNRMLLEDQNRLLLEKIATEQEFSATLLREISERERTEEALRESEDRYRELIAGSALGVQVGTREKGRSYANRACATLFGYDTVEELMATPPYGLVAEYDRQRVRDLRFALLDGDEISTTYEFDGQKKDGSIVPIQAFMQRIHWYGEDALQRTFIDLTDKKQAEEQLRQAQKMEAVGQLTGGVAHDFNNLLMVIQGNAELLSAENDDDAAKSKLAAIYRAAGRGSELTRRLLAFSRRQPLKPQIINLGVLANNMSGLLDRTLGDTIEVEIQTDADLWLASADPGQVENALLNLAINARDAMPRGGRLSIACRNVTLDEAFVAENPEVIAGEYVLLSVSDTGVGMSVGVKARAFEPFFTTKEVGEGSGLGLSMVYGFINQSGGCVVLRSREGEGTIVNLYLPRVTRPRTTVREERLETARGGGERVLVIEDNEEVRHLSVAMLESLGYRVTDVRDAAAARSLLRDGSGFDLILTDIALPGGISGREFAKEALSLDPSIRVVLMSGYASPATDDRASDILLPKPFDLNQLARSVREALD